MRTIAIDEELFDEASKWASRSGFDTLDRFVFSAVEEKILQAKREALARSGDFICNRMDELGITEEEILGDFERFRTELYRNERFTPRF